MELLLLEVRGFNEPTKQDPQKQQEQQSLHCVKIYVTTYGNVILLRLAPWHGKAFGALLMENERGIAGIMKNKRDTEYRSILEKIAPEI